MPAEINLIKNGDFSKGVKDFTSDYDYVKPDPNYHTLYGDYSVIKDPGTQFNNGYFDYGDHTSGSGKMLFVDGSDTGSNFWSQTVALKADTTYSFTYYVTGADTDSPASMAFTLNGNVIESGFNVSGFGGGADWQQVTASFTTTAAGNYALAMHDANTSQGGNDSTLDDFSLTKAHAPDAVGPNLIKNGDFSHGMRGFTSDYTYIAPDQSLFTGVGQYSIVKNPSVSFTNGYDDYGDHTTGHGEMLFADGVGSGAFWRESINLAANTTYAFTYYVTGADSTNLPVVQASLNGTAIDGGFQITADGHGHWQQVVLSFTTGDAGSYSLALGDTRGDGEGNDLTIDDLSLVAVSAPAAQSHHAALAPIHHFDPVLLAHLGHEHLAIA